MSNPSSAASAIDLDLRGLKCPLPVLRTRRCLRQLAVGDTLRVHCTDPLATIDIPHLLRQDGHRLVGKSITDNIVTFHIVKGGARATP